MPDIQPILDQINGAGSAGGEAPGSFSEILKTVGAPVGDQPVAFKQPEPSFNDRAQEVVAGNRPLFEPKEGEGVVSKVAKFIGNTAYGVGSAFFGVKPAATIINAAVQGADTRNRLLDEAQRNRVFAELDDKMAKKIRQLNQRVLAGDEQARITLNALKEHLYAINQTVIPKEYIDPNLDKSVFRTSAEAAEFGITRWIFGTPGIYQMEPFKTARHALTTGGAGPAIPEAIAKGLNATTRTADYIENAIFGAVMAATQAKKPEEKFDWGAAAIEFAFSTVAGAEISHYFNVTRPFGRITNAKAAEFAKDVLESSALRTGQEITAPNGYASTRVYNTRPRTRIRRTLTVAEEYDNALATGGRVSFSEAARGDLVRTREGLVGVIQAVEERTVGSAARVAYDEAATDLATAGDARAFNAALKRMDDIIWESANATGGVEELTPLQRVRLVKLKIRQGAKAIEVTLPEESLTKGGVIRSKELVEPVVPGASRVAAADIRMAQSGKQGMRVPMPIGEGTSDPNVKLTMAQLGAKTADELEQALVQREHAVFEGNVQPKRVDVLTPVRKETTTLEQSGISAKPLQSAEARLDAERASTFGKLRDATDAALAASGVQSPGSLRGIVQQLTSGRARTELKEFTERMFRAVDEGDLSLLRNRQERELAELWQRTSKDLIDRVNMILVASGKDPVPPLGNYITHVLTAQAKAAHELYGGVPPHLIEQIYGRRARELFSKGMPKEVIDRLLRERVGGFPIEKDFFRAANAAVETHLRFIHMQPALAETNVALARFTAQFKGTHEGNIRFIERFLNKLAGRGTEVDYLKNVDHSILEFLKADRWFAKTTNTQGIKNPFQNFFSEELITDIGSFRVPKKRLLDLIDKVGPGQWPRNLKRAFYVVQFATNIPFGVLNLSQFWTLATPRLRGSFKDRYAAAFSGYGKALTDIFSEAKWKYFTDKNVLTEIKKYQALELGNRSAAVSMSGKNPTGVLLGKAADLIPTTTEFINRVASYHAQFDNILRTTKFEGGLSANAYYKELNNLTKGELFKAAEALSKQLADSANFKYGITHRAQVSDNPVLALWDQFNSYFRNWVSHTRDMWRNFKGDPEAQEALRDLFEGKGFAKMAKVLQSEETWKGRRGELVRFITNGGVFLTATSVIGADALRGAIDLYGGGGSRVLDGFVGILKGIHSDDDAKAMKGLEQIVLPPAVPPLLDASREFWQVLIGAEKFNVPKYLIKAPYSPFRKIDHSIELLHSALTGEPVPVIDRRTGKMVSLIEPNEAMQELFFGYRSYTQQERFRELDKLSELRARDDQKQRERNLAAAELLDSFDGKSTRQKQDLWAAFMRDHEPEEQLLMADTMLRVAREKKLLMSDSVSRQLRSLSTEGKVDFIKGVTRGMSKEEQRAYVTRLMLSDAVTPEQGAKALRESDPEDTGALKVLAGAGIALAGAVAAYAITRGKSKKPDVRQLLGFGKKAEQSAGVGHAKLPGADSVETGIDRMALSGLIEPKDALTLHDSLSGLDAQFKKVGKKIEVGTFESEFAGGETFSDEAGSRIFLTRDLDSTNTALTFTHEMGHAAYYNLLSKDEQQLIGVAFRSKSAKEWTKYFRDTVGLSSAFRGAPQEAIDELAKYGASNEHEFFAEAFKYYSLTRQAPSRQMETIFQRIVQYFRKTWLTVKENAELGSPEDVLASYVHPLIDDMYSGQTLAILEKAPGLPAGPVVEGSLKKDLHIALDKVREAGWTVEKTSGGHWKLLSPDKSIPPIYSADTPSDYRGYQNFLSKLKRAGLNLRK